MPKISPIRGKDLVKKFSKIGFVTVRQKGSHVRMIHPDGRRTSMPVHSGEKVGKGLLNKILKDVNIDYEKLKKL